MGRVRLLVYWFANVFVYSFGTLVVCDSVAIGDPHFSDGVHRDGIPGPHAHAQRPEPFPLPCCVRIIVCRRGCAHGQQCAGQTNGTGAEVLGGHFLHEGVVLDPARVSWLELCVGGGQLRDRVQTGYRPG